MKILIVSTQCPVADVRKRVETTIRELTDPDDLGLAWDRAKTLASARLGVGLRASPPSR